MNLSIDEMKSVQLEILEQISLFCKSKGLKFFLSYGSLLGAVRHQGYIPWDDDIDIAMPRPDFDIFIRQFNDFSTVYKVRYIKNDPKYPYLCAKVEKVSTELKEPVKIYYSIGVNVDVFCINGASSNLLVAYSYSILARLIGAGFSLKIMNYTNRGIFKNIIFTLGKVLLFPFPISFSPKIIECIGKRNDYEKSKYVANFAYSLGKREVVLKEVYGEPSLLWFEGKKYPCPQEWHTLLRSFFGDYMTPPAIDKQVSHHLFNAYNK